jgi:hypothetical protein
MKAPSRKAQNWFVAILIVAVVVVGQCTSSVRSASAYLQKKEADSADLKQADDTLAKLVVDSMSYAADCMKGHEGPAQDWLEAARKVLEANVQEVALRGDYAAKYGPDEVPLALKVVPSYRVRYARLQTELGEEQRLQRERVGEARTALGEVNQRCELRLGTSSK